MLNKSIVKLRLQEVYDTSLYKISQRIYSDDLLLYDKVRLYNKGINKIISIDLSQVKGSNNTKKIIDKRKFIVSGMDNFTKGMHTRFENDYRYSTVIDIFKHKKNYRCTEEYQKIIEDIEIKGNSRGWIKNEEDIDNYFSRLNELYLSIKKYGVVSQADLGNPNPYREIGCVINRDGMLLKSNDGHHRFAIANLLEVKRIPVIIKAIDRNYIIKKSNENKEMDLLQIINKCINEHNRV